MYCLNDFQTVGPAKKPNRCLVLPEALDPDGVADIASPMFEAPALEIARSVYEYVKALPRIESLELSEDGEAFAFVSRSKLLRFRDDVDVRAVTLPDGMGGLCIFSRARVGYSDFGVNKRRAHDLLDAARAAFKS